MRIFSLLLVQDMSVGSKKVIILFFENEKHIEIVIK